MYFSLPEPQPLPFINFFCISAVKSTKSFLETILFLGHHKEVSHIRWLSLIFGFPPESDMEWKETSFPVFSKALFSNRMLHETPQALGTLFCRFSPWGNVQTLQVELHNSVGIPSRNKGTSSLEPAHISRQAGWNAFQLRCSETLHPSERQSPICKMETICSTSSECW